MVDWEGDGNVGGAGDPLLEQDCISVANNCPGGVTPWTPLEFIDVQAPVTGTYLIETVYFANSVAATEAANVTLTVSFHGTTLKTVHTTLAAPDDTHDLAIVHVNASGAVTCVGDVSDGADECP